MPPNSRMRFRCRYYDNNGNPVDGGCRRINSGCFGIHPGDEEWGASCAAACRYFDNSGEPIDGGCRAKTRCRFVHPGDDRWADLVATRRPPVFVRGQGSNETLSGQRTHRGIFVKCQFYEDDGSPVAGGCRKLTKGECLFVHPADIGWKDAPRKRRARESQGYSSRASPDRSAWNSPTIDSGWSTKTKTNDTANSTTDSGWGSSNRKSSWGASDSNSGWGASDPKTPNTKSGWDAPISKSGWDAPSTNSGWDAPTSKSGWDAPSTKSGWDAPSSKSGWDEPNPASGWGSSKVAAPDTSSGWGSTDSGSKWGISEVTKPSASGWGSPEQKDESKPSSSNSGWGTGDDSWGIKASNTELGAKTTRKSPDRNDSGWGGWGTETPQTENNQGGWGGGWGQPSTKQDGPLATEPPVATTRDPPDDSSMHMQLTDVPLVTEEEVLEVSKSSIRRSASPDIYSRGTSDAGGSISVWKDFIRTFHRAIVLQFHLDRAQVEYQQARRTQVSDTYGHAGAGARAILEDWCLGKSHQKMRLKGELTATIDKVISTYDDLCGQPVDFERLKKWVLEMKNALGSLNDLKTTDKTRSPPQEIDQPRKESLLLKSEELWANYDSLAHDYEEAVSYSFEGLTQILNARARDAELNKANSDKPSLKDRASVLEEQAKELNSSFNAVFEQYLAAVGVQVEKDQQSKQLNNLLKQQEDAYNRDLALVEQLEAEVAQETAAIESASEVVKRILTNQPVVSNQSRILDPDIVAACVRSVIQDHTDDFNRIADRAKDAKKIAERDAENVSVQLARALKPAHWTIEAAHRFIEPKVLNGHTT